MKRNLTKDDPLRTLDRRRQIPTEILPERFHNIFDKLSEGATIIGFDWQYVYANKVIATHFGLKPEDLIGKKVLDIHPHLPKTNIFPVIKKCLEERMSGQGEGEISRADKTLFIKFIIQPIPEGAFILSIDRTQWRIAESNLRESEARYRQLFDSSAVGNWSRDMTILRSRLDKIKVVGIKDLRGYFLKHPKEVQNIVGSMVLREVNKTALDIFGAKSAEELKTGFTKIFAKIPLENIIDFLVIVAEGGRTWVMEIKCDTLDGRHIDVQYFSTIPIRDQVPQTMITNMIDITENKKSEDELTKLTLELKRSNDDLESYSYAVSHDLKTPLRTVRSFVSFLIEDYGEKLDKTGVDYLTRMKAAVTHMDNLIEDVLTLSRVGRKISDLEAIDTKKLFQEILLEIKETGSKAKISIPKELPIIQTQNAWIRPLFHNLINNGIKYNKSKLPTVKIEYQSSVGEHLFSVVDNGIGIEKKYFEKIFSLFERLHSRSDFEGTGAGLAICKKIVDNMGGKIWVESTLGEGSSFFVSLPKGNK